MCLKTVKKALLFILPFLVFSCEIINKDEGIPAYIYIDKIDVITNYDSQGSSSSKIADAWVNVDGNLIGVFELPARIPILKAGKHEIMIRAGIKVNGIASSRGIYPFYSSYKDTIDLVPAKIDTLHPTISYESFSNFAWKDDFEDAGFSLQTTAKSYVPVTRYPVTDTDSVPNSYLGDYVIGTNMVSDSMMIFECKTIDSLYLPYTSPVFLELNYKGNTNIVVGLLVNKPSSTIQVPVITLNPILTWNKIYINLRDALKANPDALHFNVFVGTRKSATTPNAWFYIDNIKVLTF